MTQYKIGEWKKSTVETLRKLKAENDKGNKPNSTYFHNGSIARWLSILKEGGYVDKEAGGGSILNKKGIELLNELEKNPPERASKSKNKLSQRQRKGSPELPDNIFTVEITGNDFYVGFKVDSNEDALLKAVSVFKKELARKYNNKK